MGDGSSKVLTKPSLTSHAESVVRPVAERLHAAIRNLFGSLSSGSSSPTALSRRLGVNRVIVSRLMNAAAQDDPYEFLHRAPGPESLRVIALAAPAIGASPEDVERAVAAADEFADLIRNEFGTRGALNAAITSTGEDLQQRFEQTSRYHIFKGMRQVMGVEAETWLTAMVFVPDANDDEVISVTTIQGAIGMRRLRPDAQVYFTMGPPFHDVGREPDLTRSPVALEDLYTNGPAELETTISDGQLIHRFTDKSIGKRAIVDMVAVSHDHRGSRRFATPEKPRRGMVVFTDIPAKTLICDAILHESVFPNAEPELRFYKPGTRGPADPNDPSRDIDRIIFPERVEVLGPAADRFVVPEIPRYGEMVGRVFERIGQDLSKFRVCRLRMSYPVPGYQHVMAFAAPQRGK
jgi:hypothetical protein